MKNFPGPRKALENFSSYVPGKSMEETRKILGLKEIIKLASNENLWGSSPLVKKAVKKEINKVYLYPESVPSNLKKLISEDTGVSEESLIFGNGTDELIELIAKVYLTQDDEILVSENSFVRYKMAAHLMGSGVKEIPQKEFKIDIKNISENITEKTKIIFIDNPCNPTGTIITFSEIRETLINKLKNMRRAPLVVIDEAYYEYVDSPDYSSAVKFYNENVPLLILRTFSKIHGLAGLRMGYGISHPDIISALNTIRPPFNTNRLAHSAAEAALSDKAFVRRVKKETAKQKELIYRELDKAGLFYIPSEANFILIKIGSENVKPLCDFLLGKGIIIRPLAGYNLDDFIRVTVGKEKHNMKFLSALTEWRNKNDTNA